MIESKLELKDLDCYLSEQHYDDDICQFIRMTFSSLYNSYNSYESYNSNTMDREAYVKRYIQMLNKIGAIDFILDVNNNEDFSSKMKPLNGAEVKIGYTKDDNSGRFIVTRNHPEYYCSLGGLTSKINKTIEILFDEVSRQHSTILMETFIHELTHLYQQGFELPWYIINRGRFDRCLKEGHAIREARQVTINVPNFFSIPFEYNKTTDQFQKSDCNTYEVYKYLYFKLEMLLGSDFMNSWAIAPNDSTFLSKAQKIIDDRYGNNTFKKIYINMQLILLNLDNYTNEEMKTILNEQKNVLAFYCEDKNSLADAINEYRIKLNILKNKDLFKKEFEKEKANLVDMKSYLAGSSFGSKHLLDSINEKINNHTEEKYILSLEKICNSLEAEIEAKKDGNYFKMILSANINICQDFINNPNHLTTAINELETVVMRCLLKDANNISEVETDRAQSGKCYVYNMSSNAYNYKAMASAREIYQFLYLKDLFMEQASPSLSKEGNLTK